MFLSHVYISSLISSSGCKLICLLVKLEMMPFISPAVNFESIWRMWIISLFSERLTVFFYVTSAIDWKTKCFHTHLWSQEWTWLQEGETCVSFLFREFRLPLLALKYGNCSLNGNSEQVMFLSLYYALIIKKILYILFRSCELAEHNKMFLP